MAFFRRGALVALAGLVVAPCAAIAGDDSATVMVIPCLHKKHRENPNYTYQDLYALVARFHPDSVGVEIRAEDMAEDATYLRRNYPAEMVHLARLYGDRAFGFDWLGDDLAGRPVPADWWTTQSPIKKLERDFSALPPPHSPRQKAIAAELDLLEAQQEKMFSSATAAELADGRFDRITAAYYRLGCELTKGTPYAQVPAWDAERDRRICRNIVRKILQLPGRRVAIVTGANHHGPVTAAIAVLGGKAKLVAVA